MLSDCICDYPLDTATSYTTKPTADDGYILHESEIPLEVLKFRLTMQSLFLSLWLENQMYKQVLQVKHEW